MWNLTDSMTNLRKRVEEVKVKTIEEKVVISKLDKGDKGEMMANITLAYRSLEDAKMRFGKVIQAHKGRSVYDK